MSQLMIEIEFRNSSRQVGQRLLDELTGLPEVQLVLGRFQRDDPSQIAWQETLVHIKPYGQRSLLFSGKIDEAFTAVVADGVKQYLREDTSNAERRRATIYGPFGRVMRVLEIENGTLSER